jgi:hypothetical protein
MTKRHLTHALLSATALFAGLSLGVDQAAAGSIKNGSPLELTIGGHVNRAVLFVDDGNEGMYRHVDNENDSTLIFFDAQGSINEDLSVGAYFAVKMRSNASNEVSATSEGTSTTSFEHDASDIFFAHKRFGTLTMGEGSMASDGISEVDLSGTAIAGYSSISDTAGGFAFVNSSTGVRSSATIGGTSDNLDGLDAGDRLMYTTPSFNGFSLATSTTSGAVDVVARYGGAISGTQVEAAVGWYNNSSNSNNDDAFETGVSGSVSALFANGFNVSVAAGTKSAASSTRDDPVFYYAKVGYITKLNSLGNTNFAIDYGRYDDTAQNGDSMDSVGFQAVQEIEGIGSSIYLGYRYHSLDRTGSDFDAIHAVLTGVDVAF